MERPTIPEGRYVKDGYGMTLGVVALAIPLFVLVAVVSAVLTPGA